MSSYTEITRLTYELTHFIPLPFIFLLATVFFIWDYLEERNGDVVVDLQTDAPIVGDGAIATD